MASVDAIMESQKPLIDRIEKTAGLPKSEFDERFLPVIQNLAAYAHLLPATKTGHHRGPGGLLRLCLEMGMYSLQNANATIFSDKGAATAELRFRMHPRWVYASFIAGVCSELYRPVTNMVVTDEKGEKWPSLMCTLVEWASERSGKYHIIWNTQDEVDVVAMHQATAAFILTKIVPASGLQYLNQGGEVMTSLTTSVTNSTPQGVKNQIHSIVTGVRKKVVERDLKRNSELYGDFTVGTHLEPHLIDAMRKLVKKGSWEVNAKGSRIWNSTEGMFIVWQPAAKEIFSMLKESEHAGIPTDADTLCDIFLSCGIAEPNNQDGRYWEICIPVSMQILSAIKLARPELLFEAPEDVGKVSGNILPKNLAKPSQTPASIQPVLESATMPVVQETGEAIPDEQSKKMPLSETSSVAPGQASVVTESKATADDPVEPPQERQQLDETAEKLFKSLPNDVADFLRAIVEDHIDGKSTGPVFSVADGVAISVQELESHGMTNYTGLVVALHEKKWLWVNEERPGLKIHDAEFSGKKVKSIIVRVDIARSLGFNWKQPRK